VVPERRRSVRNNGGENLVMPCVQYIGGTFGGKDAADGAILDTPVEWK